MKNSNGPASPFGLGAQIFGSQTVSSDQSTAEDGKEEGPKEEEDSDSESIASEESLITAMASTSLNDADSPWRASPAYPSLYLSTASEYLPAQPKTGNATKISADAGMGDEKDGLATWASEAYENSLEVDHVFDRFSKRVSFEGEQCIRYAKSVRHFDL